MSKIVLSCSVGGLGSFAYSLALADAIRAFTDHEIVGVVGVSGGSIAAPFIAKSIGGDVASLYVSKKFKEKKIKDYDVGQQVLDAIRSKILSFLPKRRGDVAFSGLLRGNGMEFGFKKTCKKFELYKPNIPCRIVATKIYGDSLISPFIGGMSRIGLDFPLAIFSEEDFTKDLLHQYIRASCSIPLVLRPKRIEDSLYVDGGVISLTGVDVACSLAKELNADAVYCADYQHMINPPQLMPDDIVEVAEAVIKAAGIGLHSYTIERAKRYGVPIKGYTSRPSVPQGTFVPETVNETYLEYFDFFRKKKLGSPNYEW